MVIGPKGATLKTVRDQTGVKIDIPRKESLGNVLGNGSSHEPSRSATPLPESEDEPTVPITITGAEPLALEAQAMLQAIIATKTSRTTQRVKDIPVHVLPFIKPRRNVFIEAALGAEPLLVSLLLANNETGVVQEVAALAEIVHAAGGSARVAKTVAVQTLSSGPAVAVRGAAVTAARLGLTHVVTADMGGTSLDLAVLDGTEPAVVPDPVIAGMRIGVPVISTESIGAGGGSIASVATRWTTPMNR